MKETIFSKRESQTLKGIAIIMMLFHHCFRTGVPSTFGVVDLNFEPFSQLQIMHMGDFGKLCVSIFCFISGYGLCMSVAYAKDKKKWVPKQLIKTLSPFWIVVLLHWAFHIAWHWYSYIEALPDFMTFYFKDDIFQGIIRMILDFFGLSNLFGFPTIGGGWWYMSAAVVYVVAAPILYTVMKKFGVVSLLAITIIYPFAYGVQFFDNSYISFLPIFCFGMICSEKRVFDKISEWLKSKNIVVKACVFLMHTVLIYMLYKAYITLPLEKYWYVQYNVIPWFLILFLVLYVLWLPVVKQVFGYLGKHATNIFLIHLIWRWYFTKYIFVGKNVFLIILTLLAASLLTSIVIELLKKITGYNKLIDRLLLRIDN